MRSANSPWGRQINREAKARQERKLPSTPGGVRQMVDCLAELYRPLDKDIEHSKQRVDQGKQSVPESIE